MAAELILIVDDTPINLKLTQAFLLREGYRVVTAESAEEAVGLLHLHRPNLVLTDVNLPGMDGIEFARRIKQEPDNHDTTVIAWTATPKPQSEEQARSAGCDALLAKSIDIHDLAASIREFLDRRSPGRGAGEVKAARPQTADDGVDMGAIRRRFLEEGRRQAQRLLAGVDGQFDAHEALSAVHQWIGTGSLLGYKTIGQLASEIETLLQEPPFDNAQLRESLASLAAAFSESEPV